MAHCRSFAMPAAFGIFPPNAEAYRRHSALERIYVSVWRNWHFKVFLRNFLISETKKRQKMEQIDVKFNEQIQNSVLLCTVWSEHGSDIFLLHRQYYTFLESSWPQLSNGVCHSGNFRTKWFFQITFFWPFLRQFWTIFEPFLANISEIMNVFQHKLEFGFKFYI